MPDIKISDLTAATSAAGAMQLEVNDGGTSKRITVDQIKAYAVSAGSIDATALGTDAVTTVKIQNGAITPDKLSTGGLYWDTSGNVGIGTTSPSQKLHVVGVGYFTDEIRGSNNLNLNKADINSIFFTDALAISKAGTGEFVRIGSSGQLGIGGANYGTAGQVLTSGGSDAAPTWSTPGGGGVTSLNGQTGAITNTDYGAIGSYVTAYGAANTTYSPGNTVSGSILFRLTYTAYGGFNSSIGSGSTGNAVLNTQASASYTGVTMGLSGTWRCMTYGGSSAPTSNARQFHLWVRIS